MKILISTILSTKHRVGVTEYLIGLLNSLQKIDDTNEYFILTTKYNQKFFNFTNKNFHQIVLPIYDISKLSLRFQYLLYSKFIIPIIYRKNKIDVFHEPSPWFISKKINTVVTIHDVVELNYQKYFPLINFIKKKMIYSSILKSNSIITVSKTSSIEIAQITNRHINIIYNGIPEIEVFGQNENKLILKKYNLEGKKYFIFIGTLQKHKNLILLLKAFKKFLNKNNGHYLVLAGDKGSAYRQIMNYIKINQLQKNIILTGYFENNEKSALLKNSLALLLVGYKEGFGFPVLEAQKLGVPVVTSRFSSMDEILHNTCVKVDPTSSNSIKDGMETIINKKWDSSIIEKGKLNSNRYSWKETANKTYDIYNKLY